jgi:hypothetical protein
VPESALVRSVLALLDVLPVSVLPRVLGVVVLPVKELIAMFRLPY